MTQYHCCFVDHHKRPIAEYDVVAPTAFDATVPALKKLGSHAYYALEIWDRAARVLTWKHPSRDENPAPERSDSRGYIP